MIFIILGLTIFVFIKTVRYGIYEQKNNQNILGAVIIYILSGISLIVPNILMQFI